MYVKSMLSRIKGAPSKAWNDWKIYRNYPGMQYRDIHDIIPKSFMWKYPSSGSQKYENFNFNQDYFKWDYKTPYRYSPYFIRRMFPEPNVKEKMIYLVPEEFEGKAELKEHFDKNYGNVNLEFYDNSKSLSERHENYFELIKNSYEERDLLSECKIS